MTCKHDLGEMETACADGMCPLCLVTEVKRLREAIEKHRDYEFVDCEDFFEQIWKRNQNLYATLEEKP